MNTITEPLQLRTGPEPPDFFKLKTNESNEPEPPDFAHIRDARVYVHEFELVPYCDCLDAFCSEIKKKNRKKISFTH
jgi:hypothetical protein